MYPRVSWTTLQKYEECPQQFFLHREKKRRDIPERYVITGNVSHWVMEECMHGQASADEIIEQAMFDFDRRVAEARSLGMSPSEVAEERLRCEHAVTRLIELLDEFWQPGWVTERELRKYYSGWAIEGYLDLSTVAQYKIRIPGTEDEWEMRPYVTEVWDVKTGSSHRNGQLAFYSVLCEAYYGLRPQKFGWIEPLGRGQVEIGISDEDHEEMKQRIAAAVRGIAADAFPTDGFPKKCQRCASVDFCPAMARTRSMSLT